MPSQIETNIRRKLAAYLAGATTLHQFEDWFAPILWDIDHADPEARELAGEIQILLSEYSRGDRSLDRVREELTRIASPHVVSKTSPTNS